MLQKSSTQRTLEVFFISPTKSHYLMDISRKTKIAHTSIKNNLKQLLKLNLITETIEKKGKRHFPLYKANINNKLFKHNKKIYNLATILESGIINLIEEKLAPKSIVVFGSYERGEDVEDSDIDIFIECKKEDMDMNRFEKKLKRKIQLHFKENFASFPKELKNNIINGTVLYGFLEGYK